MAVAPGRDSAAVPADAVRGDVHFRERNYVFILISRKGRIGRLCPPEGVAGPRPARTASPNVSSLALKACSGTNCGGVGGLVPDGGMELRSYPPP